MPRPREVSLPDRRWFAALRRRLTAWFARHARDLPWRRTRDPYAIWLSEIMLQQTQVATVRPYFERFLLALPTVEALAAADETAVLRLWEGLGYYRRARQLHQAAKLVVAEHGGAFPREIEAARRLPGVGRYTAGAILSIAFDARAPILEANTQRLFARLLAYREPPATAAGQRALWAMAEAALPRAATGRFNQALMELGSTVCTPRNPRCEVCPIALLCPTRAAGLQAAIPAPKSKPPTVACREAAVVVRRGPRVLLRRRDAEERWAGLWDFPRFAIDGKHGPDLDRALVDGVRRLAGTEIEPGPLLATLRHGVTRFRITLECYAARAVGAGPPVGETRWVRPPELNRYPLSASARRLARLLVGGCD